MQPQTHQYTAEEKALFRDTAGNKIPCTVMRICEDERHAILRIEGWLGTHWEPLSKLDPMPPKEAKPARLRSAKLEWGV